MKRLRKIIIILSMSLFLTSALTPQHKKQADAFAITGALVLGGLAVTAMGGVIAYQNRGYIEEIGSNIYSKLTNDGIDVSDMLARNEFGLNQNVTQRMAESLQESTVSYQGRTMVSDPRPLGGNQFTVIEIEQAFLSDISDYNTIDVTITRNPLGQELTRDLREDTRLKYGEQAWIAGTNNAFPGWIRINETNHLSIQLQRSNLSARNAIDRLAEYGMLQFATYTDTGGPFEYTFEIRKLNSVSEREIMDQMTGIQHYNDIGAYQEAFTQAYNGNTVSIDYERLENIMTGQSDEVITLDNLGDIVGGLSGAITDGLNENQTWLENIWSGLGNVTDAIVASSQAVLGGISSLGDNLLDGLSNVGDRIAKANEDLWEDAGAVWTGLTHAIDGMGQQVGESVTSALTGIDQLLRDTGSLLLDLPGLITSAVTSGLTGLNDLLTDLGIVIGDFALDLGNSISDLSAKVGEIPGVIGSSITDAWSSVFAVPDDYFTTRITAIQEILNPKLPKMPDRELLFPSDYNEMGDWEGISVNFEHYGIGEQMVVDNVAPNYYRRQIKLWISAILYFFTALFVIRKIAGVINS